MTQQYFISFWYKKDKEWLIDNTIVSMPEKINPQAIHSTQMDLLLHYNATLVRIISFQKI